MKGLQLAEEYYNTLGAPILQDQFSDIVERIAVGFVGPGSECFGFDDEVSRDHDWGPAFCLWLTTEDYWKHVKALQAAYESLPKTFMNFGPRRASPGEEFRTGVCPTISFYSNYIGLEHIPANLKEWLGISEQSLAVCTNGRVFADPLGEFSRWRDALLAFYPEDIRLKKISSRCATMAQSGQYNLPRSLRRGERFAAHAAITRFCTDTMSLVFLLNKRYAPYYKWLHRAVKKLPLLGEWTHSLVLDLIAPTDIKYKPALIERASEVIIRKLRAEGLTDSSSDFLLEHAHSVHSRIANADLRQRFSIID
jgi:hypothetical protein